VNSSRVRRIVGTVALALLFGFALVGSGLGDSPASAEQRGPIYPSADAFGAACQKLGGTYVNFIYFVVCYLPNGHVVQCDAEFSGCHLVELSTDGGTTGGGRGQIRVAAVDAALIDGVYVEVNTPTPVPVKGGKGVRR
jgi:hypothetical protein